jgi:hypothetical protein
MTVLKNVPASVKVTISQNRIVAMNDDTRDLDQADTQILTPELPDEAIEAAAGTMAGTIPTGSVNIIPPNCC